MRIGTGDKNATKILLITAILLIATTTPASALKIDTSSDDYKIPTGTKACGGLVASDVNGTLEVKIEDEDLIIISSDIIEYRGSYFVPYMVNATGKTTGSYSETITLQDNRGSEEYEIKVRIASGLEMKLWGVYEKAVSNPAITISASIAVLLLLIIITFKTASKSAARKKVWNR